VVFRDVNADTSPALELGLVQPMSEMPLGMARLGSIFEPLGGVLSYLAEGGARVGVDAPNGKRFCDDDITAAQIDDAITDDDPFAAVNDEYDPNRSVERVKSALNEWLQVPSPTSDVAPARDAAFLSALCDEILEKLDPQVTLVARAHRRLKLAGNLATDMGRSSPGDPLDEILWAPRFGAPMYEPLREMSGDFLLPGVDRIPSNTLGLLNTNRRFIEAYMCGINHELAGEFLWREYPTDQRGTWSRQFWSVDDYVLDDAERSRLLGDWLEEHGVETVLDLPATEQRRVLASDLRTVAHTLAELWMTLARVGSVDGLAAGQRETLTLLAGEDASALDGIAQAIESDDDDSINTKLIEAVAVRSRMDEKLADIAPLVKWGTRQLGENPSVPTADGESLVVAARGDLFRKFPRALLYMVDAVNGPDGEGVPGLPEYLRHDSFPIDSAFSSILDQKSLSPELRNAFDAEDIVLTSDAIVTVEVESAQWNITDGTNLYEIRTESGEVTVYRSSLPPRPVFPTFRASLPPDLTFFGFPFTAEDARGVDGGLGKYVILEERVGDVHFGLDDPTDQPMQTWNDLSWSHFGLVDEADTGTYLDMASLSDDANAPQSPSWDENTSAARRAWITLQRPVRVSVHAAQMLPTPGVASP
jgi:hypothetical protein